jgi:tetratricopeptide (TPR) repeat protein
MKRIVILFFAVVTASSAYSQTYLQDGDLCFNSGDYACAITNYNEAFKLASGKDKQIAEIKLTRAKFCQEYIKSANTAFTNKQYSTAKTEYQTVLDSNPKDAYATAKVKECTDLLQPKPTQANTNAYTNAYYANYI